MSNATAHIDTPSEETSRGFTMDTAGFEAIYEKAQPGLYWMSVRLLEHSQEAEDVVTDSFVKLWHHREQFHSPEAAIGWMRVTVRNACLNLLKHNKVKVDKMHELTALLHDIEQRWNEDDLLAELIEEVLAAVARLPEKSREVFELRYLKGLRNEEISDQLGIRYQSVCNHLTSALKTLRIQLGDKSYLLPVVLWLLGQRD